MKIQEPPNPLPHYLFI